MKKYTEHFSTHERKNTLSETPQTQPIPGTNQKPNNAGGYSFVVDKWTQLNRFLILGSEGGTYYVGEKKLTEDNAKNVIACIKENARRVVDTVVDISDRGRAPKNDAALFALALAASHGDEDGRKYALSKLNKVARIGTHLFGFAESLKDLRGWSKSVSRAFSGWYNEKSLDQLALQLVKYQNRNGWAHRDIFRLSHIKSKVETLPAHKEIRDLLFRWAVKGEIAMADDAAKLPGLRLIWAFEKAKTASEDEIVELLGEYKLPWEAIPTEKRTAKVWQSLMPSMGLTALLRNLGNLSSHGLLLPGQWDNIKMVKDRLTDAEALKSARIHPLSVLLALNTYSRGRGVKGDKSWQVVSDIKDTLNDAFYASFQHVEPANKRFMLALDVSGSMGSPELANMPGITPRIGAAAMAMTIHRTEPMTHIMAFSSHFMPLDISKKDTLETVIQKMSSLPFSSTDCSLPMVYALEKKIPVDVFVVMTDSETYAGKIQPVEALKKYRQQMGIPAKLVVVGMTATQFSIADPNDAGMMDVAGFDTDAPSIIRAFSADEF